MREEYKMNEKFITYLGDGISYKKEVTAYVVSQAKGPIGKWDTEDLEQEIFYQASVLAEKVERDSYFAFNLARLVTARLQDGAAHGKSEDNRPSAPRDALFTPGRAAKGTEATLQSPTSLSSLVSEGEGGVLTVEEVTPDTSADDGFAAVEFADLKDWLISAKIVGKIELECFFQRVVYQRSLEEVAKILFKEYEKCSEEEQYRLRDNVSHKAMSAKRKLAANPQVLECLMG